MYFYRISGLSVGSDISLPGLIEGPEEDAPQVIVLEGAAPEALSKPSASGPTWQLADGRFLLRVPGVARFLLSEGREILYAPESPASARDIPIFILGTVFGILLQQRGCIVLHASAVRVKDKAVLFCGPSGAGKSTMAAALAQRGYPLVTDDVCSVAVEGAQPPTVHPDGRRLKLWAQSIKQLDLAPQQGGRVREALEKFYVAPKEASTEALALGAVYVLREPRPRHAEGIERPNIVDVALLLRRCAYRPLMVRRLDQTAAYFHAAAAIANSAGVFHLTRTLDFGKMEQVIAWLERHWRDERLVEQAA